MAVVALAQCPEPNVPPPATAVVVSVDESEVRCPEPKVPGPFAEGCGVPGSVFPLRARRGVLCGSALRTHSEGQKKGARVNCGRPTRGVFAPHYRVRAGMVALLPTRSNSEDVCPFNQCGQQAR